jgi:conjugal transfer pilus assembly protein TraE
MLARFAHDRAQSLLRQRNLFALSTCAVSVIAVVAVSMAASRPREIVLTPTITRPLTLSSAGVSAEYLELVTRDTALILLNRSPDGLDYWMKAILALAHPSAYGRLKADLMAIVTEQRGSDVSQSFVIKAMKIDPAALTSDVSGTLKTFVGASVIASEERTFRFRWINSGLHLALAGFAQVPATHATKGELL